MVYWAKPPTAFAKTQAYDGTEWRNVKSDTSGELQVDVLTLPTIFDVVSASTSVASGDNTAGVELTLDTGGRKLVHWHVKLGDAGEAKVQVSADGTNWYDTANSTSLSSAGDWDDWDFIGFRYVKVVVPTTGIDVTILISAKA